MNLQINQFGSVQITLTAAQSLAFGSQGTANVYLLGVFPNQPNTKAASPVATVTNGVSSYAPGVACTVFLEASSGAPVLYDYGAQPFVRDLVGEVFQSTAGTLNATGTLTAALIGTGIVTSTTAAAVVATLDTGAVMDVAGSWAIGDNFSWSAVNTGANAFTVTAAASGHTVVGAGAVAAGTSGRFSTRKTAAQTFVTTRLS